MLRVNYKTSENHVTILELKKLGIFTTEYGRLKNISVIKSVKTVEAAYSIVPGARLRSLQKFYLGIKIKLQPLQLSLNWKVDLEKFAITPPSSLGKNSNQSFLVINFREYTYDPGLTPIFQGCQDRLQAWSQKLKGQFQSQFCDSSLWNPESLGKATELSVIAALFTIGHGSNQAVCQQMNG